MTTPLWKQQKLEREARQARLREYYAIHRPHVVKDLGVNFSVEVSRKKNNEAKLLSLVQHMNTSASLGDSATKVTTLLPRANKIVLPQHEDETSKGYSAVYIFLIMLVISAAILHATHKRSRRPSSWERYRSTRRYYERLHAQQRKKQVKVAIAVAAIFFILSPLLMLHAIGIRKHER